MRSHPLTTFTSFISTLGIIHVCLFVNYVFLTAISKPFWDMFDYIKDYLDYRGNGLFLHYLIAPHTQHRLVWTRLITALDIEAFGGTSYPFMVFATISLVLVVMLIICEVGSSSIPRDLNYAVRWLVVMLILCTVNAIYCSIPIEDIYPHTLVFSVASLVLFDGTGERERWTTHRRIAALVTAVGASFGSAVGLVVWPILLWAAWRGRAGAVWMMAIGTIGMTYIGFYADGLSIPESTLAAVHGDASFFALPHLLKAFEYLIAYMGLPWTRVSELSLVGRIIGAALLTTAITIVVMWGLISCPRNRLERIAIGLIIFSLATAALATLGRMAPGDDVQVPVRYSIYLTPLQVGLLCWGTVWSERWWSLARCRSVMQFAFVAVMTLLLFQDVAAGQAEVKASRIIIASIDDFLAGRRDPQMTQFTWSQSPELRCCVYPDLAYAQAIVDLMKRNGIYVGRK